MAQTILSFCILIPENSISFSIIFLFDDSSADDGCPLDCSFRLLKNHLLLAQIAFVQKVHLPDVLSLCDFNDDVRRFIGLA